MAAGERSKGTSARGDSSISSLVLVTESLQPAAMEYLRLHADVRESSPEKAADDIAEADGLVVRTYTRVDESLLSAAGKLKVVGRAGVALDNIDISACRNRGVEVVHTPEANTLAVVDYTIRMMIEMNRSFLTLDGWVAPEEFHSLRSRLFGRFLADCTLGIIGCGRIGSRVGRVAAAMGMDVLYNDILNIVVDYPAESVEKEELFARSDIVTIHTPVTDLTRKMINGKTISMMKDGVQFINAARGECVDYSDLAGALESGKVSFAAIDCHDPEPMGEDYPLFGLKNVILTPHSAATVPRAKENMSMVVKDVIAVLEGRKPVFPAPAE